MNQVQALYDAWQKASLLAEADNYQNDNLRRRAEELAFAYDIALAKSQRAANKDLSGRLSRKAVRRAVAA